MEVGPGCRAGRVKRQTATGHVPVVGTPSPRGIGGTLAGQVSRMRNVETPPVPGALWPVGWSVRTGRSCGRDRMAQEAKASGRKAAGNRAAMSVLPAAGADNRLDTGRPGP